MQEETIYDNTPASTILYQAKMNTLKLNGRKRFVNKNTTCEICKTGEHLKHFLLVCGKLSAIRISILELQQPYEEDKERVIANFLFIKEIQDMERNKESLYQMWKMRNRKIREGREEQ